MLPSSERKLAAVSCSIFSSSVSRAISSAPRQPQNMLGDDVELNFAGPALDRIALGAQPVARRLAAFAPLAVPFERFAAAGGHRQLVAALVELGSGIFHHARTGRMSFAGLPHGGEALAHRRKSQSVDVEGGDLSAEDRISWFCRGAERSADAEPHAADHLALVAEEIFGDVPALVHFADDLVLGHLHVVEEGF